MTKYNESFPTHWAIKLFNSGHEQEIGDWFDKNKQTIYPDKYSEYGSKYLVYPTHNTNHAFNTVPPGYKLITFEQFKNEFLKPQKQMNKEIIGYKLFKLKYLEAALKIAESDKMVWEQNIKQNGIHFSYGSLVAKLLQDACVLDLWFKPVYRKFKEGDWLMCLESCTLLVNKGDVFQVERTKNELMVNGMVINDTNDYTSHFRLATPEEIANANKHKFKVGDWVIATGENHTKNNSSFPTTIAWKILKFADNEEGDKFYCYVDKSSTTIKGVCTNADSIRLATKEEIEYSKSLLLIKIGTYNAEISSKSVKFGCKEFTQKQVEAVSIVSELISSQLGHLEFFENGIISSKGLDEFETNIKTVNKILSKMK